MDCKRRACGEDWGWPAREFDSAAAGQHGHADAHVDSCIECSEPVVPATRDDDGRDWQSCVVAVVEHAPSSPFGHRRSVGPSKAAGTVGAVAPEPVVAGLSQQPPASATLRLGHGAASSALKATNRTFPSLAQLIDTHTFNELYK